MAGFLVRSYRVPAAFTHDGITPDYLRIMRYPDNDPPAGSAFVELSRGYCTLIDRADLPLIGGHTWWAIAGGKDRHVRALTRISNPPGSRSAYRPLFMHTLITGWALTRHLNGNRLDNRRVNLAELTRVTQGIGNRVPVDNSSGFKGVSACGVKWRASSRGKHIGVYWTAADAARSYDHAIAAEFGPLARTNYDLGLVSHDSCGECPLDSRRAA